MGLQPDRDTADWLGKIDPRIVAVFEKWGLCDPKPQSKFSPVLETFLQEYIDSREDWSDGSKRNMGQVKRHLVTQFGKRTLVAHVTPGDAERFCRWCRSHFKAESHQEKTVQKAKQFFAAAVKERLIDESPFDGVKIVRVVSDQNKQEVTRPVVDLLIDKADPQLAAIIALARYGGLRIPSEIVTLEWSRVDWELMRFQVYAPKTKAVRTVPIFPELKRHFELLWDTAETGAKFVFPQHRSPTASARRLRKWMMALIDKTPGVEPWPDLWRNLRFTRKNELLRNHKEHVVCAWIGHDKLTGQTYYDRPTEQDYNEASAPGFSRVLGENKYPVRK